MKIKELEQGERSLASVSLSACAVATEASLQKGRQLDFEGKARTPKGLVDVKCLSDTGASALCFVNTSFVKTNRLPTIALSQPCKLRLADNKPASAPNITHMALVNHALGDHIEELWCLITSLGNFNIILGMPWLEQHDPIISFKFRTMTLSSDYCMSNCLLHSKPVVIQSLHETTRLNMSRTAEAMLEGKDVAEISAYAFTKMAENSENQVIAMWPKDFERLSQSG